MNEETIKLELESRYPVLKDKVIIKRARRIFADIPAENFFDVLDFAYNKMDFKFICTITGVDDVATFGFIYHLARMDGMMLNLKISAPRDNPVIKTVTRMFPAADIYERELKDLFGAVVEGLPAGRRYPLSEDWPAGEYPLRKEWKCKTEPAVPETKNG